MSGAGLLILEATAVSAVGRITDGDLGLYSDANEAGLARILGALRAISGMPIAMQIGHAGRKASSRAPWHGGLQIPLAAQLGAQVSVPHQYWRSQPRGLKDLFKVASFGQR